MRELRFIAVSDDGSQLILQDNDSESVMTLPLDERVQAAIRGGRRPGQPEQPENTLRPRDIQARVRAGQTAEEVAASADVPLEKVLRFAGPVLAERAHVAGRAQGAVIRGSATDNPNRPLSEVVGEWVSRSDVDPESVEWDAYRRDDGKWQVIAVWIFEDDERHARFLFDPTGRSVVPDDDEARRIAGLVEPDEVAVPETAGTGQARLSVVNSEPEVEPRQLSVAPDPEDEDDDEPAAPAPAPAAAQRAVDEDEQPTAPVPMTAQRGGRGRLRGRNQPPAERLRLTDIADHVEVDEPPQRGARAADASAQGQSGAEAAPAKPRSGKRNKKPTVPSWDEIMFGRRERSD